MAKLSPTLHALCPLHWEPTFSHKESFQQTTHDFWRRLRRRIRKFFAWHKLSTNPGAAPKWPSFHDKIHGKNGMNQSKQRWFLKAFIKALPLDISWCIPTWTANSAGLQSEALRLSRQGQCGPLHRTEASHVPSSVQTSLQICPLERGDQAMVIVGQKCSPWHTMAINFWSKRSKFCCCFFFFFRTILCAWPTLFWLGQMPLNCWSASAASWRQASSKLLELSELSWQQKSGPVWRCLSLLLRYTKQS